MANELSDVSPHLKKPVSDVITDSASLQILKHTKNQKNRIARHETFVYKDDGSIIQDDNKHLGNDVGLQNRPHNRTASTENETNSVCSLQTVGLKYNRYKDETVERKRSASAEVIHQRKTINKTLDNKSKKRTKMLPDSRNPVPEKKGWNNYFFSGEFIGKYKHKIIKTKMLKNTPLFAAYCFDFGKTFSWLCKCPVRKYALRVNNKSTRLLYRRFTVETIRSLDCSFIVNWEHLCIVVYCLQGFLVIQSQEVRFIHDFENKI